jgi:hypothetical protein
LWVQASGRLVDEKSLFLISQAQKQEVSDEVRAQRQLQIRELETSLRLEEAKLLMMKKLRQSQQQQAIQKQVDLLAHLLLVIQPISATGRHPPLSTRRRAKLLGPSVQTQSGGREPSGESSAA